MYPSSKSKRRPACLQTEGEVRIRKKKADDDDDQTDVEEIMGGYDPVVRRILAKAEERGYKVKKKEKSDEESSNESEDGDSDRERERRDRFCLRRPGPAATSTQAEEEEDGWRTVMEIERSIDQCLSYLDEAISLDSQKALEKQLKELERQKKELRKKSSKKVEKKYVLRSTKGETPDKMCPVIVGGQNLEYKPWLNTDMSDILEKLPTLQEGAHPWISKLEELMVGTQPAVGDIKRLLANLLGVPAMGEILQKAGLGRYVGTAVNDAELFAATRGNDEAQGDSNSKCAAHRVDASRVTQGNRVADEAAKAVCGADKVGKVLLVTHEVDLEDNITLRDVIIMQEAVSCSRETAVGRSRSDTTDGDEQEGNFGNIDFQCVPKGAESVAVDREATKATED
ncbi:hypothetical protein NFI96_031237, partial [Prochilodus magdalenae]